MNHAESILAIFGDLWGPLSNFLTCFQVLPASKKHLQGSWVQKYETRTEKHQNKSEFCAKQKEVLCKNLVPVFIYRVLAIHLEKSKCHEDLLWITASVSQPPHHGVGEFSCLRRMRHVHRSESLLRVQQETFANRHRLQNFNLETFANTALTCANIQMWNFPHLRANMETLRALPPQRFHLWSRMKSMCQFT